MNGKVYRIVAACVSALALCVVAVAFVVVGPAPEAVLPGVSGADVPTGDGWSDASSGVVGSSGGEVSGEASASGSGGDLPVYEQGAVLVTLEDGVSTEEALGVLAEESGLRGVRVVDAGSSFVKLELPEGVSVEDALGRMEGSSVVAASQPNFCYYIQDGEGASGAQGQPLAGVALEEPPAVAEVNDEHAGEQWALEAMRLPEAWATLLAQGKIHDEPKSDGTVCVAVVDEGFNVNHEDLKDVTVEAYNAYNGTDQVDESSGKGGHGTHVAGIVAAQTNNGVGIAGVSYNARLMLVKVCDDDGGMYTNTIVDAYDHIMAHADDYNIRVVNISLGGYLPPDSQEYYDKLTLSKIDDAFESGIVTVCSAGNSSTHAVPYYNYPSDYPTAVSAINVNDEGRRNSGSNFNDPASGDINKNVSAPGTEIYSTGYSVGSDGQANDSYYVEKSGSSMASPQTAGVLALMFAANPELTSDEAVSKLFSTARDLAYATDTETAGLGWDSYTGFGMVDAAAAVSEDAWYVSGERLLYMGETTQLSCRALGDAEGVWASTNEDVATVSSSGLLTGVEAGQAIVSVTDGEHTAYQLVSVSKPKVDGPVSLEYGDTAHYRVNDTMVDDWAWESSNPAVATIDEAGNAEAVGVGKVTFTAVSSDEAVAPLSIEVTVNPASLAGATVKLSQTGFVYDGASKRPAVKVLLGDKLVDSRHYEVAWPADTVNAGAKPITVSGKNGYTGTLTSTYKIAKAPQKVTVKQVEKTIKYAKLKDQPVIIDLEPKVKNAQGAVKFEKVSGKAKIVVKKDGALRVKKGLKPGVYEVLIEVSVAGTANYEPATAVGSVVIVVK